MQLFDESYLAEVDEFMEEEGVLIAIDVAQANGHPLEVLIQLHLLFIAWLAMNALFYLHNWKTISAVFDFDLNIATHDQLLLLR